MTQDSENNVSETIELPEPSTEPLTLQSTKLSIEQITANYQMLVGFREGIREGTYQGKHLIYIAKGLMFLDMFIGQNKGQLEMAKRQEKEMLKRSREAIKEAGGEIIKGETTDGANANEPS